MSVANPRPPYRLLALGLILVLLTGGCAAAAPRPPMGSGCGKPPPASPPEVLSIDGRERSLIAVVPPGYRPERAYDLVFAFHGRTNPNTRVRGYYDLERHAPNALFVYPSGLPQGSGRSWWDPNDPADALRDYALFDGLLAWFSAHYCIDPQRVFVVGHSLGASFANSLACARGRVIRGLGSLGGGVSASACTGEVAAMVLHNPDDRLVDFSHGEKVRDLWLEVNGLQDEEPVPVRPRYLNCRRYGGPETVNPLVWCPHDQDFSSRGRYYPHTWPRGTGEAIMGFFARLPGP